uniref:Fibronectin type-III domain-containing protein n=1 Tax=Scleropages formosus TaxID=113540 RepID=A0A8C9VMW8_SCLFO
WPQQSSPALDSLQCYNDYRSYIRCSWREGAQTASHPLLSLHHKNLVTNTYVVGGCGYLSHRFQKTLVRIPVFGPVYVCAVRVRPPRDLSQTAVEGGGWLLRWNVSYSPKGSVYPTLNYQVAYRQPSQEWTVGLRSRKLKIEMNSLIPGCWYEARVRARSGKGLWSEWGSPVAWQTEEGRFELPDPVDLQCVYDGEAEVSCSWGLKRELAQFVTYSLSYGAHHDAPFQRCCSNTKLSDNPEDPLLKFSCSFYLDTPRTQIEVKLTPTYNKKNFSAHKMGKHLPSFVIQAMLPAEGSNVRDSIHHFHTLRAVYRKKYLSNEDMQQYNFSQDIHSFTISKASLCPDTQYEAQVRAIIQSSIFNGSPSEWTESVRWTTQPGNISFPFVMLRHHQAVGKEVKKFRVWKLSIPSPLKSKVLEGLVKASSFCQSPTDAPLPHFLPSPHSSSIYSSSHHSFLFSFSTEPLACLLLFW